MSDHIYLKPCPFCGKKEEIYYVKTHKTVYCRNCLSEGPQSVDETRAVAAWNERKGMRKTIQQIIEELDELLEILKRSVPEQAKEWVKKSLDQFDDE